MVTGQHQLKKISDVEKKIEDNTNAKNGGVRFCPDTSLLLSIDAFKISFVHTSYLQAAYLAKVKQS